MIYLKSVLIGLAAAIIMTVFTVVVGFVSMTGVAMSGSGGLGAISAPLIWFPYLELAAFGVGFWWKLRRGRRRQPIQP